MFSGAVDCFGERLLFVAQFRAQMFTLMLG